MKKCSKCGESLKVVHSNGVFWTEPHGCSSAIGVERANDLRSNFCRSTPCPKCGDEVFFARYNGGSVWFDSLGWPWPKHACFDSVEFAMAVGFDKADEILLGLVLSVNTVSKKRGREMLVVLEDKREIKYLMEFPHPSGNVVGDLVIVSSWHGGLIEPKDLKSRVKHWKLVPKALIGGKQTVVKTAMLRVAAVPPIVEKIKCGYCSETFSTATELGLHLKTMKIGDVNTALMLLWTC